jgi:hypothetical protein
MLSRSFTALESADFLPFPSDLNDLSCTNVTTHKLPSFTSFARTDCTQK